jgi:hypothetical protein
MAIAAEAREEQSQAGPTSAHTAAEPAGDILAAAEAAAMAALQAAERFDPHQAEAPQTGGPPAMLRDRFRIDPAQPLPEFDTPSAKAFLVEDRRDPSRPLFALICNPGLPLRMVTLAVMRSANIKGVLQIVEYGPVDWAPLGRRTMALIYDRPRGGNLWDLVKRRQIRFNQADVQRRLMEPLAATLQRLAGRSLTHRALRPDNIYFMDETRQDVVLGDMVSAPAGFDNPVLFETIERGMAAPPARGEGGLGDDLYAFGVTIALCLMGSNPVEGVADEDLLTQKVEGGTYSTVCANERLPLTLIEPLRGLLSDDPGERWDSGTLDQWMTGQRRTPIQRRAAPKAAHGFSFGGRAHLTSRTLAHALGKDVAEAVRVIRDGTLEAWLRRQLGITELAERVRLTQTQMSFNEGTPLGTDDVQVMRACLSLDPAGPIRYKGFAFMPDGLGASMAIDYVRRGQMQIGAEVIQNELVQIWANDRGGGFSDPSDMSRTMTVVRRLLIVDKIGYGIERCLYELNPGFPCQSPLVLNYFVSEPGAILPALEIESKTADSGTRPMDRHLAAFIGARFDQEVSAYLNALADPDIKLQTLGALSLLALLQWRNDPGPLFGLSSWIGGQLAPAINSYANRPTRRLIEREIPRLIRQGRLTELYDFIDNKEKRRIDREGFAIAKAQHAAAQAEIDTIESSDAARIASGERMGHQTAALFGVMVAMTTVCLWFILKDF